MLIIITRETIKKITLKHIVKETKTSKWYSKKNGSNTKEGNNEGMEGKKDTGNTDNK